MHDVAELLFVLDSRPMVSRAIWNSAPGEGGAPIWPAATCRFCSRIARATSAVVRPRTASFSGSSHTRMA